MVEVRCRQSLPYPRVEGLLPERPPARYRASKQTTREKKRKTGAKDNNKQAKKPRTKQAGIDKGTYRQRRREAGKQAHTDKGEEKQANKQRSTTSTYGKIQAPPAKKKTTKQKKPQGRSHTTQKKHIKAQTSYRHRHRKKLSKGAKSRRARKPIGKKLLEGKQGLR
ncbi:hypothetical protein Tco_0390976 [Tanacetum coccineum]